MILSSRYKEKIIKILNQHLDSDVGIFLFGSRATNQAKEYSDIDIGLYSINDIPRNKLNIIKEELSNSTIPFKIDVVDFKQTKQPFTSIALNKVEIWKNRQTVQSLLKKSK